MPSSFLRIARTIALVAPVFFMPAAALAQSTPPLPDDVKQILQKAGIKVQSGINYSTQSTSSSLVPLIYTDNLQATADQKNYISGSFTITSQDAHFVGDVHYQITILGAAPMPVDGQLTPDNALVYDQNLQSQLISLPPGASREISFGYQAPSLPAGNYRLQIQLITSNDRSLGWATTDITLGGAASYARLIPQDVTVDSIDVVTNQKRSTWSPLEGVNVNPAQQITLHLSAKNTLAQALVGKVQLATRRLLAAGTPVKTATGDTIEIAPNKSKDITLDVPTETAPGAYQLMLTLQSPDGTRLSNLAEFRYVVKGQSASTVNATFQELRRGKGQQVVVSFAVVGPADRTTELQGSVEVDVLNGSAVAGSAIQPVQLNGAAAEGVAQMTLNQDITTLGLRVTIRDDKGNILDTYQYYLPDLLITEVTPSPFTPITQPWFKFAVIGALVAVLLALLVWYAFHSTRLPKRPKNGSPTGGATALILLLGAITLGWLHVANASDTPNISGSWTINGKQTSIQQNGTSLVFTNEVGMTSGGVFISNTQVQATNWGITGTLTNNNVEIDWSNGTVWRKPGTFGGIQFTHYYYFSGWPPTTTLFINRPIHNSTVPAGSIIPYEARLTWVACGNSPSDATLTVQTINPPAQTSFDSIAQEVPGWTDLASYSARNNTSFVFDTNLNLSSLPAGTHTTLRTWSQSHSTFSDGWSYGWVTDFTWLNIGPAPTPTPTPITPSASVSPPITTTTPTPSTDGGCGSNCPTPTPITGGAVVDCPDTSPEVVIPATSVDGVRFRNTGNSGQYRIEVSSPAGLTDDQYTNYAWANWPTDATTRWQGSDIWIVKNAAPIFTDEGAGLRVSNASGYIGSLRVDPPYNNSRTQVANAARGVDTVMNLNTGDYLSFIVNEVRATPTSNDFFADNRGSIHVRICPVSTGGGESGPTPTPTPTPTLTPAADLSVTMQAPSSVQRGSVLGYAVNVKNNGPADATGVRVIVPIQAGFTYNASSSSSSCSSSGSVVTCNVGSVNAGNTGLLSVAFTSQTSLACNSKVQDTAQASSSVLDPNLGNNSATSNQTTITCTQCEDGIDNDGDGRIDSADPACHVNNDLNQPYDPSLKTESDPQCSDLKDNDGDGLIDAADPNCHVNSDSSNPYVPSWNNEAGGAPFAPGGFQVTK